ncbi:MAG: extracellular solute-binding protein [Candidatus Kaiserbacteria bacterium]|nr:extracellular solute-binding protein [Candidatus Kaiserbacteria bacterium]
MNIRPFEIALIAIFAIAGVAGLFILSSYQSTPDASTKLYGDSVEIWGTLNEKEINDFILELSNTNKSVQVVEYIQKDERTFENELLNAIADGKSPDLVLLPHTLLVTYRSKLQPISFETISERSFRDSYIDGAEIFMRSDGIFGIPFAVDPLVMYWNKDIFGGAGLAVPPKTWEGLMSETARSLVERDSNFEITQSAVAFGEYDNVRHAKDILSMLLLQAGSSIVDEREGTYSVTLHKGRENALPPGETVLSFYIQFSSPNSETYSWNRSKQLDRTEFARGNLALYFGAGSERTAIERENANLSYDIAQVPQGSDSTIKRNFGTFYAFAIPRASKNIQGAYGVATLFADEVNSKALTNSLGFAPVRRALFGGETGDAYRDVIYQASLTARGWLDPSPEGSNAVFRTMIDEMHKGQARTKSIILDTVQELENLF